MAGWRGLLLAIRFLLELALIASLAYWGLHLDTETPLRLLAGIGAPVAAILVWGRWIAPRASRQLEDPGRFVLEVALFGVAALGLADAGQQALGLVLIPVYLVDRLALVLTGGTGT